jgi:predicted HTH transcriptional regulator
MIDFCRKADLPEPDFEQRGGQFVVTIWRDWLTDAVMAGLGLNERQKKIIIFLKTHAKISNTECQNLTGSGRKTASRDLEDLANAAIVTRVGERRGAHYVLSRSKSKDMIRDGLPSGKTRDREK